MTVKTDTERLMGLVDSATDPEGWPLEGLNGDDIGYDDDPVLQWERRMRTMEVAALGAIVMLLLRRDEEMWDAWKAY